MMGQGQTNPATLAERDVEEMRHYFLSTAPRYSILVSVYYNVFALGHNHAMNDSVIP